MVNMDFLPPSAHNFVFEHHYIENQDQRHIKAKWLVNFKINIQYSSRPYWWICQWTTVDKQVYKDKNCVIFSTGITLGDGKWQCWKK